MRSFTNSSELGSAAKTGDDDKRKRGQDQEVSYENIDPAGATSPPSLTQKVSTPISTRASEGRSTPLRRKFLEEVDMSPATPPRSPTRQSPEKDTESPRKGRESPTKGRKSPTKQKLEVGQNGFYFSCELPMSKVTPKKAGTPGATTPRTRTPSPTKYVGALEVASPTKKTALKAANNAHQEEGLSSPVKEMETPNRTLHEHTSNASKSAIDGIPKKSTPTQPKFNTPRRIANTPEPTKRFSNRKIASENLKSHDPPASLSKTSTPKVRPGTPLRKVATPVPAKTSAYRPKSPSTSVQLAIQLANKQSSPDIPALLMPPEFLTDVTKEEAPLTPVDTTRLHTSEFTEGKRSKPSRESSFDIGDLMAGLKNFIATPNDDGHEGGQSAPPTPLRRAVERMKSNAAQTTQSVAQCSDMKDSALSEPTALLENAGGDDKIALPIRLKKQEPLQATSLFRMIPRDGAAVPHRAQKPVLEHPPLLFPPETSCQASEHALEKVNATPRTKKFVNERPTSPRPSPSNRILAPTPRLIGTDPSVLLAMQKEMDTMETSMRHFFGFDYSFSGKENAFEIPAMASSLLDSVSQVPKTVRPKRTLSRATSNNAASTASSMSTVRASMLLDPKDSSLTPTVKRKPKWPYVGKTPAQVRREKLAAVKEKNDGEWEDRAGKDVQLDSVDLRKVNGETGVGKDKPRLRYQPRAAGTTRQTTTASSKAAVTPARPKDTPARGTIPRGPRTSVFDSPSSAAKSPRSIRKPRIPSPHTNVATKTPTDPRPSENKFAGALDIASRVAEWNSEDRKRAARETAKEKETATPSKSTEDGHEVGKEESYTPEGSPTKLPSPIKTLDLKPATKLTMDLTPKRAAPKKPTTTTRQQPSSPRPKANPKSNPTLSTPKPPKTIPPHLRIRTQPPPRTPVSRIARIDPNAFRTPSKEIESSLDQAIDRKIEEDRRAGKGLGLALGLEARLDRPNVFDDEGEEEEEDECSGKSDDADASERPIVRDEFDDNGVEDAETSERPSVRDEDDVSEEDVQVDEIVTGKAKGLLAS
ncbi:hypothetical protein FB567DRAFT_609960 [Paraphoma chrysanthemicola]|uniref:Uncharacterized protein n=1 Tax=Paraphoma chrysanthemicola TaxID=798071 RepID=A0A8K0RII0_9PLEO|nr:hypothetical protein FB567DRAFT_609960 [Paraphoma chrysanthemicola]